MEDELQEVHKVYSHQDNDMAKEIKQIVRHQRIVAVNQHTEQMVWEKLESWQKANAFQMAQWQDQINNLQHRLKSFCVRVRNHYSTVCKKTFEPACVN